MNSDIINRMRYQFKIIVLIMLTLRKTEAQQPVYRKEIQTELYQRQDVENQIIQNEATQDESNNQMQGTKNVGINENNQNYMKEQYSSNREGEDSKVKKSYFSESYAIPPHIMDNLSKVAKIPDQVNNGMVNIIAKSKSSDNLSKLLNVLFAKALENPQGLVDFLKSPDEINPKTTLKIETDVMAGYKNDLTKGTKINFKHNLFESKDKKYKLDMNLKSEILLFNNTDYKVSNQSGVSLQFQMLY
ncbi:uncharacterized protein LOC142328092 isoform X2 [Lycorma delicatula]|uniref:uncharacterized protein LOC142328092 isoform X2 n=1 Tax=Lycorma delicatula TaxID=130591 RepID=UPI003F513F2B